MRYAHEADAGSQSSRAGKRSVPILMLKRGLSRDMRHRRATDHHPAATRHARIGRLQGALIAQPPAIAPRLRPVVCSLSADLPPERCERMMHEFSGARVRRVIDRSGARVPEHAHDWPLLSLFVMGSYSNHTEMGEQFIAGPSAVLYAAGATHCNIAGADGFEQIEIEFDPAWLRSACLVGLSAGRPGRPMGRRTKRRRSPGHRETLQP